jgi:hypothetical protein
MRFPRFLIINLSLFVALAGVSATLVLAKGIAAPAIPTSTCSVPDITYPTLQDALSNVTCTTIQVITGTYPANLVITRSVIIQGQAANLVRIQGNGAGPVISTAPGTNVTLQGLTLSDGSAGNQNGGGVVNQGTLLIKDVLIENNSTQASGGGVSNLGALTLVDSTLLNNQAGDTAGAIFLGKGSHLIAANITLSGNNAVNGGGAIADSVLGITTTATISNATIVQNSSQNGGGGIDLFSAHVSLANTILALNNNHSGLSNYEGQAAFLISHGYNLEDSADPSFTNSGDQQNANPLLLPLSLNGGSTATYALMLGSPAIDAGNALTCSRFPVDNIDQRGISRHQGASCDIGAFEYDVTPLTKTGPARAPAGEVTTYTLVISSINPYVTAFSLQDALPAGLVFNDELAASFGSPSYNSVQNKVTWNNGTFSPATGGNGAPMPTGLYGYSIAQCSDQPNQFFLIGGFNNSGAPTNQMVKYDAAEDVWTPLASLPTALANASAACVQDRIYLLGGYDGSHVLDQMFIYDVATDRWRTILHSLPTARMAAALGAWQGKLYLAGGITSRTSSSAAITKTVNVYNTANDTWSSGVPLAQPTAYSGYTQSGNYLFVAGGWSSINPTVTVSTTSRLDLSLGNWTSGPALPAKRADFALLASKTSLYAFAGVDENGAITNTVLDLNHSTWPSGAWTSSLPDLTQGTRSIQAVCTPVEGGRAWFPGGFSGSAVNDNPYRSILEDCPSQTTINVTITFQVKINAVDGHAIINNAVLTAGGATFQASARTFIPPEVSIGDVSLPEGNQGQTTLFNFPVKLSAADEQTDYITISTQDGTATLADHDYRPRYQVLAIPPGTTLVNFTVTVNGDNRLEADETFFATIVRSGDLTVSKNPGVGTILNDDHGSLLPLMFWELP